MTGDRVSLISSRGNLSTGTVLCCKVSDSSSRRQLSWNVTVWIPDAREVQEVTLCEYSIVVNSYPPNLEF